jgi:hypothetical protein
MFGLVLLWVRRDKQEDLIKFNDYCLCSEYMV